MNYILSIIPFKSSIDKLMCQNVPNFLPFIGQNNNNNKKKTCLQCHGNFYASRNKRNEAHIYISKILNLTIYIYFGCFKLAPTITNQPKLIFHLGQW